MKTVFQVSHSIPNAYDASLSVRTSKRPVYVLVAWLASGSINVAGMPDIALCNCGVVLADADILVGGTTKFTPAYRAAAAKKNARRGRLVAAMICARKKSVGLNPTLVLKLLEPKWLE